MKKTTLPPKTKTTKETRFLKCLLTQEEVLQAGEDLATALDNLRRVQAEKDSVVKSFKAKEAELEASIQSKQVLVRNKYDYWNVECNNILDYETMECYVVRLDTKEEVVRRAMSEDEKQTTLPFDGEEE